MAHQFQEEDVLFIRPGHPQDIAEAVERLLNDGALCDKLIRNGHKAVMEELSSPSAIELIIKWLQANSGSGRNLKSLSTEVIA